MKASAGIFTALFIIISVVFGWLYFSEKNLANNHQKDCAAYKTDAEKWRRLEEKGRKFIDSSIKLSAALYQSNATDKERDSSQAFTDPERAKKYIDQFTSDIKILSSQNCQGTGPTASIWVDFGIISDLVRMNEQYKIDGVRLYFAKYTTDFDAMRNDNHKYDNKYTAVFVATQSDGNNGHTNFFQKRPIATSRFGINTFEGLYNYHDLCPDGGLPPCQTFCVDPNTGSNCNTTLQKQKP